MGGCFQADAGADDTTATETGGATTTASDSTGAPATSTETATSTSGPSDETAAGEEDTGAADSTTGESTSGESTSADESTGGTSEGSSSGSTGGEPMPCIEPVNGVVTLTFGTLPDGTAVEQNLVLQGDEFACAGVSQISGIGRGGCPDELGAQLVLNTSCISGVEGPFMQSHDPADPSSCTGGGLRFVFDAGIDSVEVEFAGASVDYELIGYQQGQEVSSAVATGTCNSGSVTVSLDPQAGLDEVVFLRVEDVNAFHNIRRLSFVPL